MSAETFNPVLNHKPVQHECFMGTVLMCSACQAWAGSDMANNPCGDPLGEKIRKVAGVEYRKHVWHFYYGKHRIRTIPCSY